MKIQPTSRYIKDRASESGQVILLLGVRRSESATRAGVVARYDNGQRLNRHNDLVECMVFRPIVELSTKEVWSALALLDPPWGGSHGYLMKLYQDASGGECPVMTQKNEVAACGTTSSRFGCWTCTVVEKDRSLEGFVESGFTEFGPLLDFRDWLAAIRNDPSRRMARRRNGEVTITNGGVFVPGPFTPATRREILDRLLKMQEIVGHPLISEEEVDSINSIWSHDAVIMASAVARDLVPRRFGGASDVAQRSSSFLIKKRDDNSLFVSVEKYGVRIADFEELVQAELAQVGKQRKRGLAESFNDILDRMDEVDAS